MGVLKVIWGLLVDDIRLVSILVLSLILSSLFTLAHQGRIAAFIIWFGLIISLWVSIEYQLKLKVKNKKVKKKTT